MQLFVKLGDRKPAPEPIKMDSKKVVLLGTFGWLVALIILSALYPSLSDAGLGWWLHTAWVGVGLGLLGLTMIPKR